MKNNYLRNVIKLTMGVISLCVIACNQLKYIYVVFPCVVPHPLLHWHSE